MEPYPSFEDLLDDFAGIVRKSHLDARDQAELGSAARFTAEQHAAVQQLEPYTGRPYVAHPIAVACVLLDHGRPFLEVLAGLLHDLLEDTWTTQAGLTARFGPVVTGWTRQVSKVSKKADGNRSKRAKIDLKHFAAAEAPAQNVKLADVIVNASSIRVRDPGFARIYLAEKKEVVEGLRLGDDGIRLRAAAIVEREIGLLESGG